MKRQNAEDAKRLKEPTKEIDRHVSELLGAAMAVQRIILTP